MTFCVFFGTFKIKDSKFSEGQQRRNVVASEILQGQEEDKRWHVHRLNCLDTIALLSRRYGKGT